MDTGVGQTLSAGRHVRDFSPFNEPAYRVCTGEWIRVETLDASSGAVRETTTAPTNEELFAKTGWVPGMPMTGPIFVEGAKPGDALRVEVGRIDIAASGWTLAQAGRGAVGDLIRGAEARVFPVRDGAIAFGFDVAIPVAPMIGCIGTAPADRAVRSNTPGAHGGNMDCTLLGPGATLYLPVNVPGALLGLGDLHAAMGDGESGMAGLEVAGAVTLRLGLVRPGALPLPLVEAGNVLSIIVSAETLDDAARGAVKAAVRWLTEVSPLGVNDVNMLVSLAGQLRICQVVNPLMTCRLDIPKQILDQLGVSLPRMEV